MKDKNMFGTMGLTCCDCSYFERDVEVDTGVCLLSLSFNHIHCRNNACAAFSQRGCESEDTKQAIKDLRNKYIKEGVQSWYNPYTR